MLRRSPAFALLLVAGLIAVGADARSPEGPVDPTLHGWFESLRQPGSGASCCSVADCRPVEYRLAAPGYEALLDAEWVRVPDDKILHGKPNPTGRAQLCRSPISGAILCFVPASET